MKKFTKLCASFAAATTIFATTAVSTAIASSDYPNKPVQLIVPWGAGGDTDAVMRVIAHYTGKHLGQTVVVVNVPGVGGTLGLRQGKDARPDGYTLIATHESVISSQTVGVIDFGFDSFIPLANLTTTPMMIAARADAPWDNMKELVADVQENSKEVTFGATLGSISHFFPLEVGMNAGIDFKIVGYEGTANRQAALLGGFLDLGESNPSSGLAYFESNKLKPLGIATDKRDPLLPEVQTLAEQGIDVQFGIHRGIVAPLGTPDEVVEKLNEALARVANDPEFEAKLNELGTDLSYMDSAQFQNYIDEQTAKTEELAKQVGIAQ